MIIDAHLFYNEFDIAEIRVNELVDVADRIIAVSGTTTLRGAPNPNMFPEDLLDSVEFYRYDIPVGLTRWDAEYWLRDQIKPLLSVHSPHDIIVMSDGDEVPRADVVEQIDSECNLVMDQYYYNFNNYRGKQDGTFAVPVWRFTQDNIYNMRNRHMFPVVHDAGWEFSFFGDAEFIKNKIQSYSHDEIDIPEYTDLEKIQYRIDNGLDIVDRDKPEGGPSIQLPQYVLDNKERFARFW